MCVAAGGRRGGGRGARYIVAEGLRERQPAVTRFLFELNDTFNRLKGPGGAPLRAANGERTDVLSILPVQQMLDDATFCTYLRQSNIR